MIAQSLLGYKSKVYKAHTKDDVKQMRLFSRAAIPATASCPVQWKWRCQCFSCQNPSTSSYHNRNITRRLRRPPTHKNRLRDLLLALDPALHARVLELVVLLAVLLVGLL